MSREMKEKARKAVEKMDKLHEDLPEEPLWLDGKNINEVDFCKAFIQEKPLKCINGRFFSVDGQVPQEELEKTVYDKISPYWDKNLSRKVEQIVNGLKLEAYETELPTHTDRIHVANGTYYLVGGYTEEKQFCRNRLAVGYNPKAPRPEKWLQFLSELLEDEDILTLQEYMGYCLIPSNKGQKMLLINGKGGEGKSRIGLVMRDMLENNMSFNNIQKVETNKFARADLENQLLMVDDDMNMEALPKTSYLKTIITLESKIDLERKGKQSVQGIIYVRFMGFGNGTFSALHDRSMGFFRRQLVLSTKDVSANRINDPFLTDKLKKETEGIFLWCLEGLQRLLANNYRFTESQKAKNNVREAMKAGDNVADFAESEGYIRFDEGCYATSKQLFGAYCKWCDDNAYKCKSSNSVTAYFKDREEKFGIKYSTNIKNNEGKMARGFKGLNVMVRTDGILR